MSHNRYQSPDAFARGISELSSDMSHNLRLNAHAGGAYGRTTPGGPRPAPGQEHYRPPLNDVPPFSPRRVRAPERAPERVGDTSPLREQQYYNAQQQLEPAFLPAKSQYSTPQSPPARSQHAQVPMSPSSPISPVSQSSVYSSRGPLSPVHQSPQMPPYNSDYGAPAPVSVNNNGETRRPNAEYGTTEYAMHGYGNVENTAVPKVYGVSTSDVQMQQPQHQHSFQQPLQQPLQQQMSPSRPPVPTTQPYDYRDSPSPASIQEPVASPVLQAPSHAPAPTLVRDAQAVNDIAPPARLIKKGVEDFEFGEELGTGSYSTVVAAQDKQTLRQYAIKILDKAHIVKEGKVKYVEIEKNSLNRLGEHQGIVHLYFTFQDRASLFFVLDFAPNGELLQLIKRIGSLDEACSRYYSSQLIDAVEYMHANGIIHRDLKPENILLDQKMRIKITDFGTAKLLDADPTTDEYPTEVRAKSFVGTAEYVSPELLTQKFQDKAADIWAIGCILYQMIAGVPPFQGSTQYLTFQRIVRYQYSIPPGFPFQVRDLLKNVLVGARRRLTIPDIKAHPFYQDQDWSRSGVWASNPPPLQRYKPSPTSLSPGGPSGGASPRVASSGARVASPVLGQQTKLPSPGPQVIRSAGQAAGSTRVNPGSAGGLQNAQSSVPSSREQNLKTSASAAAAALYKTAPVKRAPSQPQPSVHYQQGQERINALKQAVRDQRSKTGGTTPGSPQYVQTQHRPVAQPRSQPTSGAGSGSGYGPGSGSETVRDTRGQPLKVRAASSPSAFGSRSAPHSPSTPPLPVLPVTQTEGEWANILVSKDERILKVGRASVNIGAIGETAPEADEAGRFAKIFNNKKKTRTIVVTTLARLLVIGDDRRVRIEVPVGVPQVIVREVLKRTGTYSIVIDTYNRMITIENSEEITAWSTAIDLSRKYLAQQSREAEKNAHSAAAAAAIAVAGKR